MKVSIVIAAKNEEKNFSDCIASVTFSDDVVVIDDHSTDKTAVIASELGARVYKRKLDGFASQKNFGIEKTKNNWVLILDADERVSPALAKEINSIAATKASAYSIPFKNHLGNHWLRYGGLYPDRHIRLFDKRKAKYGAREVHEMLEISGDVEELYGDIIHYTYKNYSEYWAKVRKYSKLEAQTRQNKPRYRHVVKEFISRYLIQKGYKDGIDGFFSAIALSFYLLIMRREMR